MAFKIKDLMIDVLPEGAPHRVNCGFCSTLASGCGHTCPLGTCYGNSCGLTCEAPGSCWNSCGATCRPPSHLQCTPAPSLICTPLFSCGLTVINPHDPARLQELAQLKEQLRQALAQVEAAEKAAEAEALPRTRQEAEALEHKLAEALEAVREMKGKLPHGEK